MSGWLVFFFSLPSKPVGNRVKVWRKLASSGALQLKGSVYVLPEGDEQRGFFQWLAAEVAGMGGESAFVSTPRVETLPDADLVGLFDKRREADYRVLEGTLDALAARIDVARQTVAGPLPGALEGQIARLRRDFNEVRRTDFFCSAAGRSLAVRLEEVAAAGAALSDPKPATAAAEIPPRSRGDYQGRRWATRARPFVDRMASAWLIRRFVDPAARFEFIRGDDGGATPPEAVVFDAAGGEFTHVGDLCTFEVLVRAFSLDDPALAPLAEIVHDLDAREERRRRAEAAGVEALLEGIRRTARDDDDALERGMAVFEALRASGLRREPPTTARRP